MFKNMLKGFSIVLGLILVVGCATKPEVRGYIEVKDRVDQEMEGNAGFVGGMPKEVDRSEIRKTRKTYVLEVSQGDPVPETTVVEDYGQDMNMGNTAADDDAYDPYESDNFIEVSKEDTFIPFVGDGGDEDVDDGRSASATEYKVQKDDTLQKISKKFYDSFSKWTKIYDANRDVIEDPDRIKPGTVIQIPAE